MNTLNRLIFLVTLLGCATTQNQGNFVLEGKILGHGNTPMDNVEIQLASPEGKVLQTTTSGGGGVFSFPDLATGTYLILIDVENQPDGPLGVEPLDPIQVSVGSPSASTNPVVIQLKSTLNAAQAIQRKYAGDLVTWMHENRLAENQNAVVFAGSSSIRLWKTLSSDFPNVKVLNRGFGGSTAFELKAVLPLILESKPRVMVLYEGDNDLASVGSSVDEFIQHMTEITQTLAQTIRKNRIILLSIKPSRSRWARWPAVQEANRRLEQLAAAQGYTFVDVSTPLLVNGEPNDALYGADRLHLSEDGYRVWTRVLRPVLERVLRD